MPRGMIVFAQSTTGKTYAVQHNPLFIDQDDLWRVWLSALRKDGWIAVKNSKDLAKFRKDVLRTLVKFYEQGKIILLWDPVLAEQLSRKVNAPVKAYIIAEEDDYVSRSMRRFGPGGSKQGAPSNIANEENLRKSWANTVSDVIRRFRKGIVKLQPGQYLLDFFD
jgi:hypothetical protein